MLPAQNDQAKGLLGSALTIQLYLMSDGTCDSVDAVAAESESGEWSGNTTWVLSQDQAKAVATALEQQQEHGVVPLEVTIGLQCSGKASKRGRKHKSQETLLPCTLKLKIIPRYNPCAHVPSHLVA